MHDSYLFLTPVLTLLVVALVGFVGCDALFGLDHVDPLPPSVMNFTATAGNQVVTLAWEGVAGATGYTISMGTSPGMYIESRNRPAGETSYPWPMLTNGTTYYFTMTASTPNGETARAPEQSATPSLQGVVTNFITSKTFGTTRNDFGGWVGVRFTLSVDILALSLARISVAGNAGPHMVKLVHAVDAMTKTDVPGGVVTVMPAAGTPDEFVYVDLAAPIPLNAGNQYYLITQEQLNGDLFYNDNTAVTVTNIAPAVFSVFGTNQGAYTENTTMGFEYGPVDFKYTLP